MLVAECCRVSPSEAQAAMYSVCARLQDHVHALEKLNGFTPEPLPSIAGRMEMSHEAFQQACREVIKNLNQCSDSAVLQVLCEAVRCSRECCDLSSQLQGLAARVLEKAKTA
jgi:hypothetical protein